MRLRPHTFLSLILVGLLGLPGCSANAQGPGNWQRLESMPVEQRLQLSHSLDEFDLLPADQQERIRKIDAEIAKLAPADQVRVRTVMKRYHIWLQRLTAAQKSDLDKVASLQAKVALIEKWKKAERQAQFNGGASATENLVLGVHPGDLGIAAPFEMANLLRVWNLLYDNERARVNLIGTWRARRNELIRLGREMKDFTFKRFPIAEEEKIRENLEQMDQAKLVFRVLTKKADPNLGAPAKKGQSPFQDKVHHLAESIYFMKHPPVSVTREHLAQFEAELPGWFRSSLDPLSAEDARRRLTILYRLIYEPPNEITIKPRPAKKTEPTKPLDKAKPALVPAKNQGNAVPL